MALEVLHGHQQLSSVAGVIFCKFDFTLKNQAVVKMVSGMNGSLRQSKVSVRCKRISTASSSRQKRFSSISAALSPLDLTEDNVTQVLADARVELAQLFDSSVGMTGAAELFELDGPYVKISLRGRFWHKRSDVLARLGNYLKQRIPEILEVDIEDEKQLDDSPENF